MQNLSRRWPWLVLLLVVLGTALVRWHLRSFPLERDEGEYAYAGQLVLHGVPPYTLLYTMKLPGTFFAYAAILLIFGQTSTGIHLGLLLVNALTIVLMFLLGRRLFGDLAGVVSAVSYALFTASPAVLGFAGHATNFVVLAAIPGVILLLKAVEVRRAWLYFWSGLLFGVGFLMKQPGILLAVFGGVYLLWTEWRSSPRDGPGALRRIAIFAGGVALPFGATCVLMLACGVFDRFWFWTFSYAREYGSITSLREGLQTFRINAHIVVAAERWLWLVAALGLTTVFWNRNVRRHWFFLYTFFLFSCIAVCPGLYFRRHYFILMLPASALLTGAAVSSASETLRKYLRPAVWSFVPLLLFIAACAATLYHQRAYLFEMAPRDAYASIYAGSPFPEAVEIGSYIKSQSAADARIAVLGSEPEIYFYANRRSATGYIYTYGLMEQQKYAHRMQQEMIAELEAARPEFIVFVGVPLSFGRQPDSDRLILDWMTRYLSQHYDVVGVADMLEPTEYFWGVAAQDYRPRSGRYLKIYRRK